MKLRLFFLFVIACLITVTKPVNAASFDCGKAKRAEEKLICLDPELSKLDEVLARTYKKAREGLSEKAQKEVADGQRSWLKFWMRACSTNGRGTQFDRIESLECAQQKYEERNRMLLKHTYVLDGKYRVYPVDLYIATQALNDDGTIKMRNTLHVLSYPQLDLKSLSGYDFKIASKLNTFLSSKSDRFEKIHKNSENIRTDANSHTTVVSISPRIVGICEGYYYYPHGNAHGEGGDYSLFFDKEKMNAIQADGIFWGRVWIQVLSEYSFKSLRKKLGVSFILKDAKELATAVSDIDAWWFTRQGLRIQFPLYSVGSYVHGTPVVVVPWKILEPYLTNFSKAEISRIDSQEFPDNFR